MSKIFWNALKISPALLGASLLVANSTYAAESVTEKTTATTTQAAATVESTVEPLVLLPQTTVLATKTPAAQTIPTESAATPLVEPTSETEVSPVAETSATQTIKPAPSTLAQQAPASGNTNADSNKVIEQINNYNNDVNSTSVDQITNVTQLRDVSPSDWAYEALRTLIANYGCLQGYPDRTFRGNRALSRYEFAAGLNACLTQIERIITTRTANFVTRKDLETIQRLVQDFRTELTTLGTRLNTLEGRVSLLEDRQFSTTTKLNAEVIFAISDMWGNRAGSQARDPKYANTETVLQDRVRLNFDTSFTGKDRLRTRLQAGNFVDFGPLSGSSRANGLGVTKEGRFGFAATGENSVSVEKLWYRTPIANAATIHLFANAGNFDDFVPLLNGNLDSSGSGSISRFGRYNPIYRMGAQNAGVGLTIGPKSPIRFDFGYLAGQGNGAADPGPDAGIFNGSFSALGQVTFQPTKALSVAATYVHSYNTTPGTADGGSGATFGLGHGTGSIASQLYTSGALGRPVVGNSYGLQASFSLSPKFVLSGWAGYTNAIVLQTGRADIWNYGATLALNDFGTKGSTLGFVFGMEPKLTDTSNANVASRITGLAAGQREDRDTGFHVEGFYKFNLTRNISVTPGVIWLTAPGHDNRNDDIVIGTIRTTFTF